MKKPTVLVVDDEEPLRNILEEVLCEKYDVMSAQDGNEALEVMKKHPHSIDVLLSDIQMPNMDGITLLGKMRELYPDTGVIMISGQGNIQTAIDAMRIGAFDYITKPIMSFDELDIRLGRYFEKRKLENQLSEFVKMRDSIMQKVKVISFVSFDVVDSHGLKLGADMLLTQFSFTEYHKYMNEKITKYTGKINSTAGDGIMCSFENAQSAVESSIEIQRHLKDFNKTANKLARPFRLRCGIHTGSAMMDKEGNVEHTFARVLDVAGHIQKRCGENEVIIGKETFDEISNKHEFTPMDVEVDGVMIFKFSGKM